MTPGQLPVFLRVISHYPRTDIVLQSYQDVRVRSPALGSATFVWQPPVHGKASKPSGHGRNGAGSVDLCIDGHC